MRITISGASDDLIVIGGDIEEEFNWYQCEGEKRYVAASDGTLLSVDYNTVGDWRFAPIMYGSASYHKKEGVLLDDTPDVVTLDGDIKWVAFVESWTK